MRYNREKIIIILYAISDKPIFLINRLSSKTNLSMPSKYFLKYQGVYLTKSLIRLQLFIFLHMPLSVECMKLGKITLKTNPGVTYTAKQPHNDDSKRILQNFLLFKLSSVFGLSLVIALQYRTVIRSSISQLTRHIVKFFLALFMYVYFIHVSYAQIIE